MKRDKSVLRNENLGQLEISVPTFWSSRAVDPSGIAVFGPSSTISRGNVNERHAGIHPKSVGNHLRVFCILGMYIRIWIYIFHTPLLPEHPISSMRLLSICELQLSCATWLLSSLSDVRNQEGKISHLAI
jgi:hypothetical protein